MLKSFLILIMVPLAAVALACGDEREPPSEDGEPTPSPAPAQTASPTVTPPSCPINPAACTLAVNLQAWLSAGSFANIALIYERRTYDCPGGTPQGAGGPFPLCDGAPVGEKRVGLGMARRYSERWVLSQADYVRIIGQLMMAADTSASDAYGPGSFRLYSVSCLDPGAPQASCPRFAVIFSGILRPAVIPPVGTVPGREVLAFLTGTSGGSTLIESTWTGIIMPDEAPVILQQGGTLFDLGRIYPYRLP